jgi:hypothetical protein
MDYVLAYLQGQEGVECILWGASLGESGELESFEELGEWTTF